MSEKASIQDLAWLSGTWRGRTDEGDVVEEIWGEPMGRAAAGLFRWMRKDEVYIYEILVLEEADDGVWMRLRHFAPGLVPAPDEGDATPSWRLVANEGRRAVFENAGVAFPRRLVYQRASEHGLVARLEGARDGEALELEFRFTRR